MDNKFNLETKRMEEAQFGIIVISVLVIILLLIGNAYQSNPSFILKRQIIQGLSLWFSATQRDPCFAGLLLKYCSFCIEPESSLDSEVVSGKD